MDSRGPVFQLRELTLAGFGVYRQPTHFLFPEGCGLFFGPNETGKSTFVRGLAAVWFGLPASSDSARAGTGRFRSFGEPIDFYGELVWEHRGRRLRLHRNFETHHVRLSEESTGQIDLLFEGEHNPLGRSSAGTAFPPVLRDHLGLSSLDLFLATFCLGQPLPDCEQLGGELQHLLSGSQDARIDEVRERLFARIKSLTLATGELGLARPGGIRPTNQREPGRIEELEGQAARVRLDLAHGKIQLERLNTGNQAIEEAQAEQGEANQRRRDRQRRLVALTAWTERNAERVRRAQTVQLRRNALSAVRATVEERAPLLARLSEEMADLAGAPGDLADHLERVERAAQEYSEQGRVLRTQDAERTRLEARRGEIQNRLQGDLATYRGRSDWSEIHAALTQAVGRRTERVHELTDLRTRLAATTPAAAEKISIEAGRTRGQHYLEAIERLEAIHSRSDQIRAQLEEREYLRENGRLESLQEKFLLEVQLKECSAALRETRLRAEARETAAFREAADLRHARHRKGASITRWIGVTGSAALGTGLSLAFDLSPLLALLIAVGAAAIFYAVHRALPRGSALPKSAPSAAIGSTGERVNSEDDDEPAAEGGPETEAEFEAAKRGFEGRLRSASADLGPYTNTTPAELARMEGRWQTLDDELAALAKELSNLLPRLALPAGSAPAWREIELPPEMISFLDLPGAPEERTQGALADWLRTLQDEDWDRFQAAEETRSAAAQEWRSLADRIERREVELAEPGEVEALESRLRPFTLADDPAELASRAREASDLERDLDLVAAQIGSIETPPATNAIEPLRSSWESLIRDWPAAAASAPWNPIESPVPPESPDTALGPWAKATRERLLTALPLRARVVALAETELRILHTENCVSRVELEESLATEEAALGSVVRELETLESQEILLSAGDSADPTTRAQQLEAWREREKRAEQADQLAAEGLETRIRGLHRTQASLEGAATPNVAALEIEARILQEDVEEARRECDALAMAYRWLDEALQSYHETHREQLASRITDHFRHLTSDPRRIELDERFAVSVVNGDGQTLRVDQLSQGARDQLLLAIRLAVADLLSASVPLPFFFDDPFLNFDTTRLEQARQMLLRLGQKRPWILLTHRTELAQWADPVFVEAAQVQQIEIGRTAVLEP